MIGDVKRRPGASSDHEPDRAAWKVMQDAVRSFRQALRRGEHPAIEAFLPQSDSGRRSVLRELIHEELEVRVKDGDWSGLARYFERYPAVAADADLAGELAEAEEVLLRRRLDRDRTASLPSGQTGPLEAVRPSASTPLSIGRYELGEVVGRGAFGVVHRAYDTALGRVVALKRPQPGTGRTPETAERFLREARVVSRLRHPSIVPIHDAGQCDGELYLVGDLIEGRNLADVLADGRPGFRRSAEWAAELAEALDHAHALGLVHRDVKPSNILVDAEDRIFLTDFGLARNEGGEVSPTADDQLIGTPAYMAPEQTEGTSNVVDARVDVYSLGVVLYEMLTASRPFAGAGPMLLVRIREEEPSPPRRLDDAIPRDLETVCLKAMARRPADRYADAASLATDLRRWLRGEPVQAEPSGASGGWRGRAGAG